MSLNDGELKASGPAAEWEVAYASATTVLQLTLAMNTAYIHLSLAQQRPLYRQYFLVSCLRRLHTYIDKRCMRRRTSYP